MSREDEISSEFNSLRGKILGLFESFGLPERQERAIKSTFKGLTYDFEKTFKGIAREFEERIEELEDIGT